MDESVGLKHLLIPFADEYSHNDLTPVELSYYT